MKTAIYPPPDRAIASRAGLVDVLRAYTAPCALGLVLFCLVLAQCTTEPDGPSAAERQVIGSWAASVDVDGTPWLLELGIDASKDYRAQTSIAGALVSRDRGKWALRGGRWHSMPATCEEADAPGDPLRPASCGPPDSVAVNIAGDTWTVNLTAGGQVRTLHFKRL